MRKSSGEPKSIEAEIESSNSEERDQTEGSDVPQTDAPAPRRLLRMRKLPSPRIGGARRNKLPIGPTLPRTDPTDDVPPSNGAAHRRCLFLRSHDVLSIKPRPASDLKGEAHRLAAIILGARANRPFGARWRDHLCHHQGRGALLPGDASASYRSRCRGVARARDQQRETGTPFFLTLAREESMAREAAMELMQQFGQKLFSQLWVAPRVWFMFEKKADLLADAADVPGEPNVRDWALETLASC